MRIHSPEKNKVASEYCRKNPELGNNTIARALYRHHPKLWETLNAANCTVRLVRGNMGNGHRSQAVPDIKRQNGLPDAEPTEIRDFDGDKAVLSTRRKNVRTLDELLAYMEVDLELWDVERYVINKWEVGAKDDNSKVQVTPLYQVKAWLKRKTPSRIKIAITELLAEFKTHSPVRKKVRYPKTAGNLLEVDIFDPHFGKLCWSDEVRKNYDLKIAAAEYGAAVTGLLHRTKGFDISRIVYPVGNDFFHADNINNTTTAGTTQDVDGRWQKSFVNGRKAVIAAILELREIAPVDILMIPGNHDTERVFYLGEVLAGWMSRTPGVTVNNKPTFRKYYHFGKNLIGYTHGNCEKPANLPLIMATEEPVAWSHTKFREFHTGHIHHKRTMNFFTAQEFNSIRVRSLSSLTPADAWHHKMGYEGLRSASAFVWNETEGCIGEFSHNA